MSGDMGGRRAATAGEAAPRRHTGAPAGYEAVLAVLAHTSRPLPAAEIAARLGMGVAAVESRLKTLVAWGDVAGTDEGRTAAEFRAGDARFELSELGARLWGRLPAPAPAGAEPPPIDPVARWERLRTAGALVADVRRAAADELALVRTDLDRERLSPGAFGLLLDLLGRALAGALPGEDAYVADADAGLGLHLLRDPGGTTSLYGSEGVVTVEGFALRLTPLRDSAQSKIGP